MKMAKYETYWRLEKGKGIRIAVVSGRVILQQKERINGKWKVVGQVELTREHLEKLFVRIPYFFQLMKGEKYVK